jgi:hypothetical protein
MQHILNTGHSYRKSDTTLDIGEIHKMGKVLNTLQKCISITYTYNNNNNLIFQVISQSNARQMTVLTKLSDNLHYITLIQSTDRIRSGIQHPHNYALI